MLIAVVTSKVRSYLKFNSLILHLYLSLMSNGIKQKMKQAIILCFSQNQGEDKIESTGRRAGTTFKNCQSYTH